MKTLFPKTEAHIPKLFIVDAKGKTLGRLATEISKLLRGKENAYYTPGIDQGNYVIVLNAKQITITGKKASQKLYYRTSQRPGTLKIETFEQLQNRIPIRILEKAVWGMLPKGVLGRNYYKRLYVYEENRVLTSTKQNQREGENFETLLESQNWIQVN